MDREDARELAAQIHACLNAQDWPGALERLAGYCEAFPEDRKCWYLRALAEWKLGNAEAADRFVDRALAVSPDYDRARELKERLEAEGKSFLTDDFDLDDGGILPTRLLDDGTSEPADDRARQQTIQARAPAGLGDLMAGRYKIIEPLGAGGMGQVWKAADTQLHDRPVAVKRVHRHMLVTPQAVRRFEREVKTLAGLTHPYIVSVTDSGRDRDGSYYVMEFVAGRTLRRWLEEHGETGPPSFREILPIFTQIARAVAFAHSRGVIHRDLKPENIVITDDGTLQMFDFGLAHSAGEEALTREGQTAGTPLYMAPEQARGEQTDERTDVYSLGAMLYELTTLKPPFAGENWLVIIDKHQHEPAPPLRAVRPDAPLDLEAAVTRALQKEPDDRYQGVKALLADVQRSLSCAVACAAGETNEALFRQLALAAWADGVLADEEKDFLLSRAKDMDVPEQRGKQILFDAMP